MSQRIRIGEVRAVSVEHSWQLIATVHARVTSASPSTILPPENLLACIKEYSPFISRASGLHLSVHVLDNGAPFSSDPAQREFLQGVAEAFSKAALWKQLELDVTYKAVPSPTSIVSSQFVLEVRHATNIDAPEKRRLHRLPVGTSAADLHPPVGIAWLGVEQIVLELDYRHVANGERTSSKDMPRRQDQLAQSLRKVRLAMKASQDDNMLEDGNVLFRWQDFERSPLLLVGEKPAMMPLTTRHSPTKDNSTRQPDSGAQVSRIHTTQALELADAAFRSIIRSRPEKLAIGTWLPKIGLELDLATLVPSLWQPRYATAMNERVCLLPTITHALSRGLLRRAQSASLKAKLQALQSHAEETFRDTDPAQPGASSLSRLLRAKLWQVVQHGVWNGDASKALKPLTIAAEKNVADEPTELTQAERIRTSLRDVTSQRQPQADAGATLRSTPLSPVLQGLGLLHTSLARSWDGGLLAQPVFSTLTQLVWSAGPQAQAREQNDFEGFEDMLEEDDDFLFSDMGDHDSLFGDEDFFQRGGEPQVQHNLGIPMLGDTQVEHRGNENLGLEDEFYEFDQLDELDRPIRHHDNDNDSLFSYTDFEPSFRNEGKDSLLDDENAYDDTPPTSQESTSTVHSAQQEYMAFRDSRPLESPLVVFREHADAWVGQRSITETMHGFEHEEEDFFQDLDDEDILAF